MKQVKQIVVALLLFVATTSFVNAQSKVAHIDVTQLLSAMPEMKAAEETESLEEKKAELESGVNLDRLWSKQQDLQRAISKETNRLNDLKEVGDKYVKIINSIALDFKQLDTAEYASLFPERIQKKIKVNRMILEMQNSIEYEPL